LENLHPPTAPDVQQKTKIAQDLQLLANFVADMPVFPDVAFSTGGQRRKHLRW
jgi:hypothetical protein